MTVALEQADRRLTHSQIATARSCLRKHQLAYVKGIRKHEPARPLRWGSAFHLGLDIRAQLIQEGADAEQIETLPVTQALAQFDQHIPPAHDVEAYADFLQARAALSTLLGCYSWRYAEADANLRIVATELQFEIPIINPDTGRASRTFTQAGKLDKIVELPDGRLALMEHKTAGVDVSPGSDYWRRLLIDSQISTYVIAARALGYNIDTVLYDVIRKPTIGQALLTQGDTQTLLDTGEYMVKRDDTGQRESAGQLTGIDVEYAQQTVTVAKKEQALDVPTRVVIAGEEAEIALGGSVWKRDSGNVLAFSIRETPYLYALRLAHDVGLRPDYYFVRREIPRSEDDIYEARIELWEEALRIHHHEKRGVWPRNSSACKQFGQCQYFDLCTNGYKPDSGTVPEGYYITENIHQELEEGN